MAAITLFPIPLGFMHCFEAGRVLTVASVSTKETRAKSLFYQGVSWGIGHLIPIIIISAIYIWSKFFLLDNLPFSLEIIVEIVLIVAGTILSHTSLQSSVFTQILYFLGFSLGSILGMGLINSLLGKIDSLLSYIKKVQWLIPLLSMGYGIFIIYKFV